MVRPEDIHCPVCGYYCLGRGGLGCIDKPSLVDNPPDHPERRKPKRWRDLVKKRERKLPIRWFGGHGRRDPSTLRFDSSKPNLADSPRDS